MKIFICAAIIIIVCTSSTRSQNIGGEHTAKTVREFNEINPDGSYNYAYETSNQIFAEQLGFLKDPETQVVQGQYQYTSPEGRIIRLAYVADEDGFHPQGEHLPTPPPIPKLIQKALEYLARLPPQEN